MNNRDELEKLDHIPYSNEMMKSHARRHAGANQMINTPIKRHETFTSSFCDKYGCFLDDNQLNESVKIINNHAKLLQSLRDMVEIVGANFCSNQDVKRKYKIARELLEQNK